MSVKRKKWMWFILFLNLSCLTILSLSFHFKKESDYFLPYMVLTLISCLFSLGSLLTTIPSTGRKIFFLVTFFLLVVSILYYPVGGFFIPVRRGVVLLFSLLLVFLVLWKKKKNLPIGSLLFMLLNLFVGLVLFSFPIKVLTKIMYPSLPML